MTVLVTGSAGHLGEALMRTFRTTGQPAIGLDRMDSEFTDVVGSVSDRKLVDRCLADARTVIHAATLHKPHVATHRRQDFVDVNVTGTLNLLESAVANHVDAFIFTSTTSAFGDALVPPPGEPAAWITEEVRPVPKNIYGTTKVAAEDLCQLFHRDHRIPTLILRTSRFFAEEDDNRSVRESFADDNIKANEFVSRRVDIEDAVAAHCCALRQAASLGFGRYIISATTPFTPDDLPELRRDAQAVFRRRLPELVATYEQRGWSMFPTIDRVYDNAKARRELLWQPQYDVTTVMRRLDHGQPLLSDLATTIGKKGYHEESFADGPYPTA